AAGVLKHRKRKEKALRKLEATDGNLQRLVDLLSEIRRQLKPLGRQAEVARRAAVVQADVRDARARLLADDIVTARTALETELADESALREKRSAAERSIASARQREAELEDLLHTDAPRLSAAQETWYHLSGLRERMRGTAGLAAERIRLAASASETDDRGRDPEELDAEAVRTDEQETEIAAEVEAARAGLDEAITGREQAESAYSEEERRVAGLVRAAADRREGLARLHGQVNALKSRARAAEEELARLEQNKAQAQERADRAQHDFTALETQVASLDAGEGGLDEEHEVAQASLEDVTERLAKTSEAARVADRERAALVARKEALELGLARKDGAGALLAADDKLNGMLGSVAALLTVRPGYEGAVAAALGSAADAVAVDEVGTAVEAIHRLKEDDLGRAGLLLGGSEVDDSTWPGLPGGATYAVDAVDAPDTLAPALSRLLFKVAVVDDLATARTLVADTPDVIAVTRDGDLLGSHFATGGSSSETSLIEVQAAVDQATQDLEEAAHSAERLTFEAARLTEEQQEAQQRVDVALAKLHESDAAMAAMAENLGHLGSTARSARGESERLATAIVEAEAARDKDLAGLAELEERLGQAEQSPEEDPDTTELETLASSAKQGRQAETDARLALRTSEERARALSGRAAALRKAAQDEREARERARQRRERQRREAETARAVV
ncbi:MAG: chromosome segregation protein SMC, partial [Nocardioidaceae bacterium]